MATGMSREDARREAIERFGDIDGTRQYCRRQDEEKELTMQRRHAVADLMQDLRIAIRGLLRAPVLAVTIVATVGLGIGATAAIFAIPSRRRSCGRCRTNPQQLVRIFTDARRTLPLLGRRLPALAAQRRRSRAPPTPIGR